MRRIRLLTRAGVLFLSLAFSQVVDAQIKIVEGSINALKSESKINVEFTFDDMSVGKIKSDNISDKQSEAEYIAEKVAEKNKKTSGKGDEWAKAWVEDRKKIFEPHFLKYFEKGSDMQAGSFNDAKYTLIYKTTFIDPGEATGTIFGSRTATIIADAWIVETAKRNKVIAKLTQSSSGIANSLFDTGQRIGDAYYGAGRLLGKFIKKN